MKIALRMLPMTALNQQTYFDTKQDILQITCNDPFANVLVAQEDVL